MSLHYVFTYNNPTVTGLEFLEVCRAVSSYVIFQLEVGEQGTPHFQGYIEFTTRKRIQTVKNLLNVDSIHLERRRGTQDQACAYASKEESRADGPWEAGTHP